MDQSKVAEPLRSKFRGDAEMTELVQEFVQELPSRINSLGGFLRAAQFDELRRAAHQLKGAAGGYGFPTISDSAAKVENLLKSALDQSQLDAVNREVQELVDLCRRATAE